MLETYLKYYEQEPISAKASLSLWWESIKHLEQLEYILNSRKKSSELRINTVKIMIDGVIESKTASSIKFRVVQKIYIFSASSVLPT